MRKAATRILILALVVLAGLAPRTGAGPARADEGECIGGNCGGNGELREFGIERRTQGEAAGKARRCVVSTLPVLVRADEDVRFRMSFSSDCSGNIVRLAVPRPVFRGLRPIPEPARIEPARLLAVPGPVFGGLGN